MVITRNWFEMDGLKNAPKASLTPHWPAAYVTFKNVLKERVDIACKAGVFRCAIDLDFRLTES